MTTNGSVGGRPSPPQVALARTITGLSVPWGVVAIDDGVKERILIVETGANGVTSLTPEGDKMSFLGGARGSAEGQFCGPRGIAVDATNGTVLVTDAGNHRLQMFRENGELVASVGTEGSGALQFKFPVGVGINGKKMIYVCDRDNNRVQILHPDLTYCGSFGCSSSGNCHFSSPLDVAFDSRSNVYVVDSGNHCVQVYTEDGQFLRKFGRRGGGRGELYFPTAVCVDSGDVLHVVDETDECVRSHATESFCGLLGPYDTPVGWLWMGGAMFTLVTLATIAYRSFT